MILIGIDPGLHTGIAVVQVSDLAAPVLLHYETANYAMAHTPSVGTRMRRIIDGSLMHYGFNSIDNDIQLVIEKFVPEARKVDTTALEVIGELAPGCHQVALADQAREGWRVW